jgi:Concanavalin A-like lectin/glucanases superfamily
MVTTVYDRRHKRVLHYVDGQRVNEQDLVVDQPLRIGPSDIGNWGVPMVPELQPIRNFNGRIDELAVWNIPLTARQILDLYEVGHP